MWRTSLLFLFTAAFISAAEPAAVAPTLSARLQRAAYQIGLDDAAFGPGAIDGRFGQKTTIAERLAWQSGRLITPSADPFVSWQIPADFTKDLCPIPESWMERSKLSALGFQTIREKLAEMFHVSEDFLSYLNPRIPDWTKVSEGETIRVPKLSPRKLPKADSLHVSLSEKVIVAYDAQGMILASFPCSIAAKKEKRPVGKLEVRVLASKPDYVFDPAVFSDVPEAATIKSKLIISPGPNNPVGDMWIGLSLKGYGIHGTPWPEDIGKTESHGCFRLANWDARRLGTMIRIAMPVHIEE